MFEKCRIGAADARLANNDLSRQISLEYVASIPLLAVLHREIGWSRIQVFKARMAFKRAELILVLSGNYRFV